MLMRKIRSMMRIPLDNLSKDEQNKIKEQHGKITVIRTQEPCLTCGRHKMMKYTQRIDGKLFILEECLYCTVKIRTVTNGIIV